eukprot:TRINITY_DN5477_c3_g1_i2.p1 TRINITY_DN5477_c3_g1~~TRINITY_DN5477_c3_g1_i2.p1  ORF type:complete len:614 (-),score=75.99 TRINITY_DN5477_c3_g1_i2:552-2393(-)
MKSATPKAPAGGRAERTTTPAGEIVKRITRLAGGRVGSAIKPIFAVLRSATRPAGILLLLFLIGHSPASCFGKKPKPNEAFKPSPNPSVPGVPELIQPFELYTEPDLLLKEWTKMYHLAEAQPGKVARSPFDGWKERHTFPFAPHLEDCLALHEKWRAQETRGPSGEDPPWLHPNPPLYRDAQPPWVVGANADNLAGTRYMQALLWQHQFPPNCSDPSLRFALVRWTARKVHGLGSQIHLMAQAFAFALASKRILVPYPGTFERADHDDCPEESRASLDCYYFPITPAECSRRALEIWKASDSKLFPKYNGTSAAKTCNFKATVVEITAKVKKYNSYVPQELDGLWDSDPFSLEVFGKALHRETQNETAKSGGFTTETLKASWWRAQAVRFMLRRPQPALCHSVNKVRHQVFGPSAASVVARIPSAMIFAEQQSALFDPEEQALLKSHGIEPGSLDDSPLWRDGTGNGPFVPRPLLSMHVRQGDKARESNVFSLAAHMWLAERMRRQEPTLDKIWLSTIVQEVTHRTHLYKNWTFFYEDNKSRTKGQVKLRKYEVQVGISVLTTMSFVDLQIAATCDYFIGALSSNWARMQNELRLTGGKLRAGFLAVNFAEW